MGEKRKTGREYLEQGFRALLMKQCNAIGKSAQASAFGMIGNGAALVVEAFFDDAVAMAKRRHAKELSDLTALKNGYLGITTKAVEGAKQAPLPFDSDILARFVENPKPQPPILMAFDPANEDEPAVQDLTEKMIVEIGKAAEKSDEELKEEDKPEAPKMLKREAKV